jgi:hypothetical protein
VALLKHPRFAQDFSLFWGIENSGQQWKCIRVAECCSNAARIARAESVLHERKVFNLEQTSAPGNDIVVAARGALQLTRGLSDCRRQVSSLDHVITGKLGQVHHGGFIDASDNPNDCDRRLDAGPGTSVWRRCLPFIACGCSNCARGESYVSPPSFQLTPQRRDSKKTGKFTYNHRLSNSPATPKSNSSFYDRIKEQYLCTIPPQVFNLAQFCELPDETIVRTIRTLGRGVPMSQAPVVSDDPVVQARAMPPMTWNGTLVGAAETFPCEKCNGPVIVGALGTRHDDISQETNIRKVGAACIACGFRPELIAEQSVGHHFRPVEWKWLIKDHAQPAGASVDSLRTELQDADADTDTDTEAIVRRSEVQHG